MFPLIDLIATVGGLVIPPAFDFIKKKFVKGEADTPERTISTLATTKPEALPEYVRALSEYKRSEKDFFNRDVIGECSQWVNDLRAAIRPIGVAASMLVLSAMVAAVFTGHYQEIASANALASDTLTGVRVSCEAIMGSWYGSRMSIRGA